MTNTTTFKRPRTCKCGRTFEASAADTTVNCPACRKAKRAIKAATTRTFTTCRCGKTVTSNGVTCPRRCG